MDQQLKQRLIGTTIVVSLVVIFVPLFFEDKTQRNPNAQMMEMTELPRTLEERAVELPKSAADAAESGNTESTASNSGYRIIPLNDPPPKAPGRANSASGRDMSATESGTDEEFAILDEGTGRNQESATQISRGVGKKSPPPLHSPSEQPGAPSRAAVYPLDSRETGSASLRNKPAYPTELPVNSRAVPGRVPANESKPLGVPETTRPQGDTGAWMIQAGSFTGEANARNLVEKLRKSNFPAFVEVIPGESGNSMYRVRIGPELSRARAEQVRARIESTVGIKGMIVPHQ